MKSRPPVKWVTRIVVRAGRRRAQGKVEVMQAALRDANPEPLELSRAKLFRFCREQGISKQQTHAGANSLS